MQRDYHYCVIRLLAEKAGFSPEESQIIAYASEYVDDAIYHEKIKISGGIGFDFERFDGKTFDPVCTAHRGVQFLKAFNKEVQKKIYLSFHFIPYDKYSGGKKYNYLTVPNSRIINGLLESIIEKLRRPDNCDRILNLIELGIALHSFADTWSHQDFSGRHNHEDNDIEGIQLFENRKWKKLSKVRQTEFNMFPDIGHAEAYIYPDLSHLTWKFRRAETKEVIVHKNFEIFKEASQTIYGLLLSITGEQNRWSEFEERFFDCLKFETDSVEEKIEMYKKIFAEIGFYYNEKQWKNEALVEDGEIENEIADIFNTTKSYKVNKDNKWFKFHQAALNQRKFVMSNIKSDLI